MAFYKGKEFRVKVDTKELMHEIDFSFDASKEFQDLASKDVPNAANPGKHTWDLSGNGYIDNSNADAQQDFDALYTWFEDDSLKPYDIGDGVAGNLMFSGTAYMANIGLVSTNNEVLTYSFTLKVITNTKGTTA